MCGIVCSIRKAKHENKSELDYSLDRIKYRGIDASGSFLSEDKKVFLGHSRLSIIDVSDDSNQPMLSKDENYVLVFNGEIYNYLELKAELIELGYEFLNKSDSEVIINGYIHWGDGIFEKLNGPFSIALYSKNLNKMWIARDRAGEKPLYYYTDSSSLSLSSDMGVVSDLSKIKSEISLDGLHSYLIHGYTTDNLSLINGVKSVKPGHFFTVDCSNLGITEESYWPIPKSTRIKKESLNLQESVSKLDSLLLESVNRQLRSDVPLAVMLSGGVDSSLITAYAAESIDKLNTFTVAFPGHSEFDESASAKLIAEHFGTNHTVIDGAEIKPQILEELVESLDTPIIDSSLIPTYMLYKEVSKKYKVAIGGDGADELFGGYKHYSRYLKLNDYGLFAGIAMKLFKYITFFDKNKQLKFSNWMELFNELKNNNISNIRKYMSNDSVSKILEDSYSKATVDSVNNLWNNQYNDLLNNHSSNKTNVDKLMLADFSMYLRNSILIKSDRCSMMNGVESRAPFLDTEVIDFAFGYLNNEMKVSKNQRKIILKELCKKRLPSNFDLNRKLGFNLPFAEMIRNGEWNEFITNVMLGKSKLFSFDARKELLDEHLKGRDHSNIVFGIVLLMLWCKKEGIDI